MAYKEVRATALDALGGESKRGDELIATACELFVPEKERLVQRSRIVV